MHLQLRGLHHGDIAAWNRLLADIEAVQQSGEHYNEADLAEEMANPELTPGEDIVGAFVDDTLVGYFAVYARSGVSEVHRVGMEGGTHPDWRARGVGTQLATAMMARARAAHAERQPGMGAHYELRGLSANHAQEQLMADIGLTAERWTFVMRADLAAELPAPGPLPDGMRIAAYEPSMSQALLEAHNAAFADHPNFAPWTEAMWQQWVTGSRNFRPDLSLVVLDPAAPDRIAAYVQTNEYDAYFEMTGRREAYVAKVGTRREHRGRGLASGLLRHSLAAYRAAGLDEASLDVDSENPTGALGVYTGAGFAVESRWTDYALLEA